MLDFRPIGEAYDRLRDRIVAVSASPDLLHIYNPATNSDETVSLPGTPLGLALNSSSAIVPINGRIAVVDLQSRTVARTYAVAGRPLSLLASATHAYFEMDSIAYSLSLSTGVVAPMGSGYRNLLSGATFAQWRDVIYGQAGNLMFRIDLRDGSAASGLSRAVVRQEGCRGMFPLRSGLQLLSACGVVLSASSDSASDLWPVGRLSGLERTASVDESERFGWLAALSAEGWDSSQYPPPLDRVYLFDRQTLKALGQLQLPAFPGPSTTYRSYGRRIFFNSAGTTLYVLMQADASAGLSRDFAIQSYPVFDPPPCSTSVEPASSIEMPWTGGITTIKVTAEADCIHGSSPYIQWIQVVRNHLVSGTMDTRIHVRANYETSPRSNYISVGGHRIAVTQAGRPSVLPERWRISFPVSDAKRIGDSGRLALLSSELRELHILNPISGSDVVVPLPGRPTALDVRPDGKKAVVGQDAMVSIVDLDTATVERTTPILSVPRSVHYGANGFVFGTPEYLWAGSWSMDPATGKVTPVTTYAQPFTAFHPGGRYLYTAYPGEAKKWDTAGGSLVEALLPANPYPCNNLWFANDGRRALTGCGSILQSDVAGQQDLSLLNTITGVNDAGWRLTAADYSSGGGFAAIAASNTGSNESNLFLLQGGSGTLTSRRALPKVNIDGAEYQSIGSNVFWRPDGGITLLSRLAGSPMLLDDLVVTAITPNASDGACRVTLGATEVAAPATGLNGSVTVISGPDCAWRAVSTSAALVVSSGALGLGSSTVAFTVAPNYSQSALNHTLQIGESVFTVRQVAAASNGTPSLINSSPVKATAAATFFDLTMRDADGAANLSRVYFQIGDSTAISANGCHGFYDHATNTVTVYNDALTSLLTPVSLGTAGTVANSQCAVNGAESSAAASGPELSLRLALTLKGAYLTGTKRVYFWVTDQQNHGTGWVQTSDWALPSASAAPQVSASSPAAMAVTSGIVRVTVQDANGAADIQRIYFVINGAPSISTNGCHGFYDRRVNSLYLYDDALTTLSAPLVPGTSGVIQNSQCRVSGASSRIVADDASSMTLELQVDLQGSFRTGSRRMYYWPVDAAGLGAGWVAGTSWSLGTNSNGSPAVVSSSPATATAATQTFSFVVRDPDGYANISRLYFLINPTLDIPANTCHGFYDRSTGSFALYSDGLSTLSGPIVGGRTGTLENSQCAIDISQSYVHSASGTDLAISLRVTLKGPLTTGTQRVALWAQDLQGNGTGWQSTSSWTARPNAVPVLDSATPSISPALTTTLTVTVRDADGVGNVSKVYFLIAGSPSIATNGCHGFYDRPTNSLVLYNDALTAFSIPIRPGQVTGSAANGQCKFNGAGFSAVESGMDLQLTLTVTLQGAFSIGSRNAYFWAVDEGNAGTGWQLGTKFDMSSGSGPAAPTATGFFSPVVSGASAAVGVTVTDGNGLADIDRIYFLIAPAPAITVPYCHGFYERSTNRIYLYHSELPLLQSIFATPGKFMSIADSAECRIDGERSSVSTFGESLTLILQAGRTKTGPTNVYWWVTDRGGLGTGWVKGSTWN